MLLVVDNGSVYTENLVDLLKERRVQFEIKTPQFLDPETRYDSVILSGRRHNDSRTNAVNSRIILRSIRDGVRLLGICYGAEILALTLGGTIRRSVSPQNGNQTVKVFRKNPISEGSLGVFESHRFEIAHLPDTFVPLAESDSCRYEIIRYEDKPVFGVQFHPEMSLDGRILIEKFCSL